MKTLNCILFDDGVKAYFFDGRREDHICARPGESEIITFSEETFGAYQLNLKKLKIPYAQWARRWAK